MTPPTTEIYIDNIKQDLTIKELHYDNDINKIYLHLETLTDSKRHRISTGFIMADPKDESKFVLCAYLENQDKFVVMRDLDLNSIKDLESPYPLLTR